MRAQAWHTLGNAKSKTLYAISCIPLILVRVPAEYLHTHDTCLDMKYVRQYSEFFDIELMWWIGLVENELTELIEYPSLVLTLIGSMDKSNWISTRDTVDWPWYPPTLPSWGAMSYPACSTYRTVPNCREMNPEWSVLVQIRVIRLSSQWSHYDSTALQPDRVIQLCVLCTQGNCLGFISE